MLGRHLFAFAVTPLLFATALINSGCVSSIRTYRVNTTAAKNKTQGVYYALPRTIVGITVPVILTQLKAGPSATSRRFSSPTWNRLSTARPSSSEP